MLTSLLLSCDNDDNNNEILIEESELFDFVFKISNFKQKVEDMDLLKSEESDTTHRNPVCIKCVCFKEDGTFYKAFNTEQNPNDENFGKIEGRLPAGKYYISVSASEGGIDFDDNYDATMDNFSIAANGGHDFFHSSEEIVIERNTIEKEFSVDRVVGVLDIIITDSIPSDKNIDRIVLGINNFAGRLLPFRNTIIHENGVSEWISLNEIRCQNNVNIFSYHTIGMTDATTPCTVIFAIYDKEGIEMHRVEVGGIKVFTNKRTILEGSLFNFNDSTINTGINVNINQKWDEENVKITF